ncbi:MAG: sporulation transcriptional regulator SpoIIID [Bacillota bacterium]|jgi:putative DeoR family transcriptional regulator (stage III sporulation protein D)
MQDYIARRVMEISRYMLESRGTVRQTASVFGVSKSTVHKDLTERLPLLNEAIAGRVREILEVNKAERHIRGGEATKRKYRGLAKEEEEET